MGGENLRNLQQMDEADGIGMTSPAVLALAAVA